ncbi:DUF3967 domain-containing protein [Halobacillus amylolyticus]|uniref:DUF3967 domain-containing protein n=1 Tax=Halobacillus amylolyticus TaxID=2932259 RepID=A0ABY4HH40_9BACI|nr:DUF3967 domain-containing protein [Halobacillus amylolyticus]UOR14091.1 DUF3967 domain-containing protein [Halobacillus amylolyticus]
MSDDTQKVTIYNASDVASILNLKLSTLRKYANVLHKAGYRFHKNEKGHRGYFDKDVMVMRRLMETKNHPDMTLEQASNAVMSWVQQNDVSPRDTTDVSPEQRYISYDKFREFQEQQEEQMQQMIDLNKELINRLDQQQEYLDNRLQQRDEQLMNAINQTLETKRQIAASSKQEEEEDESKKPGFFKRLFSKE